MICGKATLHFLVSWFPVEGQVRVNTRRHQIRANKNDIPATGSQLIVPVNSAAQRTLMPDLRQCEPWRQAMLRDETMHNDYERLTR